MTIRSGSKSAKSTPEQYGTVAITIHWLSVVLILILLGSGIRADGMEEAASKVAVLRTHVPVGVAILILTLVRIAWWLFADKKPVSVPMPNWQGRLSQTVHVMFYVVILGMTASGIGMMILSGAGPIIFGGQADTLPDFWNYALRTPHGLGAKLMFGLFVAHAGAALYHQFVVKDSLMKRMWYR